MSTAQPPVHQSSLKLHRSHPTTVSFFDEAGAISCDRFFVVGLLRVADHVELLKDVKSLRKQFGYWDEFKWATMTSANEEPLRRLVDLLMASEAKFSAFVADRHVADPVARFGDTFRAYEKLAAQLLIGSAAPYEVTSVLADNYSEPNHRSFERTVRTETNRRLQRLAVTSVVRVDSAATEGLQLVDVLTGAVAFNFKAMVGLASTGSRKSQMSQYVLAKRGLSDLNQGATARDFRVKIYEHGLWLSRQQASMRKRTRRKST